MRSPRFVRLLRVQRSRFDPLRTRELPGETFELTWRRRVKRRALVVFAFVCAWATIIELRLVQLQVFRHAELSAAAKEQQELVVNLDALRGDIVDRRGNLLAYSVDADSIAANPSKIEDPERTAAALCAALGDCNARERKELATRLASTRQFAYVRRSRSVSPDQVQRVADLKLPGIFLPPS